MKALLIASALALLAGCAAPQPAPPRTVGEFGDDAVLTARVKAAIARDVGMATAAAVNVQSYRGVVQLSGFVATREEARRAAMAAGHVEGVRQVANDVRLKPGP